MNLKVIVAILLIAVVPVYGQAQRPSAPKVNKGDAQRVLKIIQSDKAKTKIYCEMAKIGNQLEQINEEANPKKFEELSRKMEEMGKRLGPEYGALIDGVRASAHRYLAGRAMQLPELGGIRKKNQCNAEWG